MTFDDYSNRMRRAQSREEQQAIEAEYTAAKNAAEAAARAARNRTIRAAVIAGVSVPLLLIGSCSALRHSTTVEAGNVGVKIKSIGSGAGVDPVALPTRWYYRGIGETIIQYPVIERRYSYTRESNDDGHENEELAFVDKNGLPITGDANIGLRVRPAAAPALYVKYKATLDQLLDNQIRNDVRSAVARYAASLPVEQMLGGGHQVIMARAYQEVKANWAKDGVDITRLEWSGALRFPSSVTASIQARAQADQQVFAATARVAVSEANARVKVADAQGDANAMRIRGEALRANPQMLEQLALQRWNGQLPQVTSGATPFVNLR